MSMEDPREPIQLDSADDGRSRDRGTTTPPVDRERSRDRATGRQPHTYTEHNKQTDAPDGARRCRSRGRWHTRAALGCRSAARRRRGCRPRRATRLRVAVTTSSWSDDRRFTMTSNCKNSECSMAVATRRPSSPCRGRAPSRRGRRREGTRPSAAGRSAARSHASVREA